MNKPTIDSTPDSCAGRPATVAPNTTSCDPLYRLRSRAHAPSTTVFSVTWCVRANRCTAAVSSTERARAITCSPGSQASGSGSGSPNRVTVLNPARRARQNASARAASWRRSQAM